MASVHQIPVPPDVRRYSTLDRLDYADSFVVELVREGHTTEEWARLVLEGAPAATRTRLVAGWSSLGLQLAVMDRNAVLGWRVRRRSHDFLLVGAESALGFSAELLFRLDRQTGLLATLIAFRNPLARAVWAGIEPLHVRVVPSVLRDAAHFRRDCAGATP